ncbi:kinase-like protein [Xylaria intraflava]|nr:kinase-like protein [Xylaria intraflava]
MSSRPTPISRANAKKYFEAAEYWEFEKCLGRGSFGMAVLLREKKRFVQRSRRMAVKVALARGREQLENEIKWLKVLRGGKHIVKMLASCRNLATSNEATERMERYMELLEVTIPQHSKLQRLPPSSAFVGLAGMQGPAMALEYIEGRSLLDFKEKVDRFGMRIPNRVLWSFFLCLIRACIGLAYPLGRPEGAPSILETIPSDGREVRNIAHHDIAPRNIMLGRGDSTEEHATERVLKLIDFGATRELERGDGPAPAKNLFEVADSIAMLIRGLTFDYTIANYKGHDTRAGPILRNSTSDPFPGVDADLRDLIARCMYVSPSHRPSLQEALEHAQRAVLTRLPDSFPSPALETDGSIREFWQRLHYDA